MSYRQAPHGAIFRSSLYGSWYLYGKWCRVHISMLHKNVRKSLSITANMILLSVTICGTMGTSNASIGHKQHVMSPYLCLFWKKRGSPHRHFVCLLIWSRYSAVWCATMACLAAAVLDKYGKISLECGWALGQCQSLHIVKVVMLRWSSDLWGFFTLNRSQSCPQTMHNFFCLGRQCRYKCVWWLYHRFFWDTKGKGIQSQLCWSSISPILL